MLHFSKTKILFLVSLLFINFAVTAKEKKNTFRIIFTDQQFQVPVTEAGEYKYSLRTVTENGLSKPVEAVAESKDGKLAISAEKEGINIVKIPPPEKKEIRFLSIPPPPQINKEAILQNLSRQGKKLLDGEEFTILAMGDSVTATGDYEKMLAMLLERATGNKKIKVVTKAYPGRSIDASVRHFARDVAGIKPDLVLIMYGLNDQICFCPLEGYLEQYQWLAKKVQKDFDADCVFLQPTPHIDVLTPNREGRKNPPEFAFRTIGFAKALKELAKELKVPCVNTFNSLWLGRKNLYESAKAMQAFYPTHYSKKYTSLFESGGKGDTIHPNALGHLQMAKAVYNRLNNQAVHVDSNITGFSEWTDKGVVSTIKVQNKTDKPIQGHLKAYPFQEGKIEQEEVCSYNLHPGQSTEFKVKWPQAVKPEDLLKHPNDKYLSGKNIMVPLVKIVGKKCYVQVVDVPFAASGDFVQERMVVDQTASVKLRIGDKTETLSIQIPPKDVGRIPLIRKFKQNGKTGYAVAELAFVKMGQAKTGDPLLDGELADWQDQNWIPVGEPCQARWVRGSEDYRTSLDEAYLKFAFKAGQKGLFIAIKGKGQLEKDRFTIYFDTRAPEKLGSAGPYYWVSGKFDKDGKMKVSGGETTTNKKGLAGKWTKTPQGINAEIFVPYHVFDQSKWPKSGDLGLSINWMHRGDKGQITHLQWSEDGHPWNSRWYGVVRLTDEPENLPYVVRVK